MDRRLVLAVAVVIGLFNLVLGAWAFVAPRSFFDAVATFEPYNRHLLHDVGAFQAGLGATLLGAVVWRDALFVALAANGLAAALHFVSHLVDRDLGGRASDPVGLGILMVVVVAAALYRIRGRAAPEEGDS